MSWTWEQNSGKMYDPNGNILAIGYSGAGAGKNNSTYQTIRDVGPIPEGNYSIGTPEDTVTHGPHVLPLTPDPSNTMYGRSGFLIHGDSLINPGNASEGCIILPRFARDRIGESPDKMLLVVSHMPSTTPPATVAA